MQCVTLIGQGLVERSEVKKIGLDYSVYKYIPVMDQAKDASVAHVCRTVREGLKISVWT
jgi:hypothetical protein